MRYPAFGIFSDLAVYCRFSQLSLSGRMNRMTVLQRLLEADLVEIHDDAEMEKLAAAAALVEKQLTDGKLALAPATLVAMDPHISPDEPVLDAVYAAVAGQWPTVKKRHPNRPVAVLRGVLAQALAVAGKSDTAAGVIWATASSYAPHAPLAREANVWAEILDPIGERAERAAAAAWSGRASVDSIEIPGPELPQLSIGAPKLDGDRLKSFLAAAAGPTAEPPQGITPNRNNVILHQGAAHATWADTFGTTAAQGIGLVVNAAFESLSKSMNMAPVTEALEKQANQIAGAVAAALAPLHSIELRSRVLLWRSALYSTSQRQAYRDLSPQLAIVAIAADLAADVPPLSPASVDNLVWESAYAVFGTESTSILAFVNALTGPNREAMAALLGTETAGSGRKTLASFLRAVPSDGKMTPDLRAELGVEADMEIRMADLARWLFRDLRAERIGAAPARSRRRGGK